MAWIGLGQTGHTSVSSRGSFLLIFHCHTVPLRLLLEAFHDSSRSCLTASGHSFRGGFTFGPFGVASSFHVSFIHFSYTVILLAEGVTWLLTPSSCVNATAAKLRRGLWERNDVLRGIPRPTAPFVIVRDLRNI